MTYLSHLSQKENSTGLCTSGPMPRFGEFTDRVYWPAHRHLSHTTRDLYRGYLRNYILPLFADAPLDEITHEDVQIMIDQCPTASTGRKARDAISSVLGFACDELHLIEKNPARGSFSYGPRVDGRARQGHVLQSAEDCRSFLETILGYLPGSDVAKATAVGLLFGLRPGETLGLDTHNVDLEGRKLRVEATYTVGSHSPVLKVPKTPAGFRTLPISDYAFDVLSQFQSAPGPYIRNSKGIRSKPRVIARGLQKAREACGLPNVTFESMRHSFATAALKDGWDVAVLAAWLGHSNPVVTLEHYCRADFDSLRDAARSLDAAYYGKRQSLEQSSDLHSVGRLLSNLGSLVEMLEK